MEAATATAETFDLFAANGRYIRKATRVRYADGRIVEFTERIPKGAALDQAAKFLARDAAR